MWNFCAPNLSSCAFANRLWINVKRQNRNTRLTRSWQSMLLLILQFVFFHKSNDCVSHWNHFSYIQQTHNYQNINCLHHWLNWWMIIICSFLQNNYRESNKQTKTNWTKTKTFSPSARTPRSVRNTRTLCGTNRSPLPRCTIDSDHACERGCVPVRTRKVPIGLPVSKRCAASDSNAPWYQSNEPRKRPSVS